MKITLNFLKEILQKSYPDLLIESFREEPGSNQGDNYTAVLYRVHIMATKRNDCEKIRHNFSVIYKRLPDSIIRRKAFKSDTLFCNEVIFYTIVLPTFLQFQDEKLDDRYKFTAIPKCFLAQNDIIVLQDLCNFGYKMIDRKIDLSYETTIVVLKELAKFHALSLGLKLERPQLFFSLVLNADGVRETFFTSENEDWYKHYYEIASENALKMVKEALQEKNLSCKYYEKFKKFLSDNFFKKMISLVKPIEPFSVICHGDCWTNNILRQTKNNQMKICFIDFQMCRYASPVLDLVYLLYLCTAKSLRDEKLTDLLDFYIDAFYEQLTNILIASEKRLEDVFMSKMNFEQLVFDEFRRCSAFALGVSIDMIPILTCDSDQAPNLYEVQSKCERNIPVTTTNSLCKEKMTDLLIELVDNAYL